MNRYKVCVVMSTYNGEQYIEKQIESILNQQNVDIELYIRDDGSNDGTITLLRKLSSINGNIHIDVGGGNLGFANSFHTALLNAPDADYYAFSDQDDYWYPNKIETTLKLISDNPSNALAFQNAILTDAYLHPYAVQYLPGRTLPKKENVFYQSVGSGFLMLFHKSLRELATRVKVVPIPYDMFISTLAYYFGNIQYSYEPVALHRRLNSSVSNGSPYKLIKHRLCSMFYDNGVAIPFSTVLLNNYSDILQQSDIQFLSDLKNYRASLKAKYNLLRNKNLAYSGAAGYCLLKMKVLINRL